MLASDDGPSIKRARCDDAQAAGSLPPPLVAYARRLLEKESARAGEYDVDRLLVELEALSRAESGDCDVKAFSAGYRRRAECLASAFRNRDIAVAHDSSVTDILRVVLAHRDACAQARSVIGTHHQQLRVDVATASEPEQAWQAAVSDAQALQTYAEAAAHTGRRSFVRDAHDWCVRTARDFFHGSGAADAVVKDARRLHFKKHGARLPPEAEAELREAAQVATRAALAGAHIKVLDIGSCHDPWRLESTDFDVVALDLQPAAKEVYRCDFLTLDIGTCMQFDPPQHAADGAGRLHSLPASSFHVAVLSLVLSYIPDPLARCRMIALARRLLHDTAGLLLIVTPISTNAGFTPQRQLPVLKEWNEAIGSLGFERHAYDRLRTVHVMAYRKVPAPLEAVPLKPLRIAYDERATRDAAS
jgi:hypothetical protein